MSFGFSIGDIVAATQLARSIWKGFAESPDQFRAIRSEVGGLYLVLDDVARSFGSYDLTNKQKHDLQTLISGCRDVLTTLDAILQKYGVLDCKANGLRAKTKKAWERLKWDQSEIIELRARLTSHTALLDAFNGSVSSQVNQDIKIGLKGLDERVENLQTTNSNQERETIINWLSPLDFCAQHQDFIGRRQAGTGQRFLNSEKFVIWSSAIHGQLFCPGIPGAGKTIMASTIVDHLKRAFEGDDVAVIYLYCNYRRKLEQTALNLLGSLTQQLSRQRPGVSEELQTIYERHVDKKLRPNLDEIQEILQSEVGRFSKVFVVLDALDECINSHDTRDVLTSSLRGLISKTQVNLLVTSRFIPEATNVFQDCPQLEIRAEVEDVKSYVEGNLSRLPKFVLRNMDLQNTIVDAIAKAVDGMFLLAQLHLDSLSDKTSPKALKIALQKLPKGSDALELAYNSAVERIDSQKPGLRDLADQVLSWITYARRPLRTKELQHALAIEIDETELDEENFSDIEEMINVCAGLVTVDENSKIIRFIHYTTQEYFESIRKIRFPTAADHVALCCITYLMHDDLEVDQFGCFSISSKCDLVEYSAEHWGHHAREATSSGLITPPALRLLRSDKRLRSYLELIGHITSTHWQSSPTIALWVAAYFGLEDAVRELLASGGPINCKLNGETALYVASTEGYASVVKLLLDAGADVELTGGSRGTALSTAAYHGHNEVIRMLIPRSFPWWRHGTALREATEGGHNETVKLLLEEGADINSPYGCGENLAQAISKGHESVARIFFNHGANIESCRAMSLAAGEGHINLVNLLIERERKDVEAKSWVQKGIEAAACRDHEDIVVRLLQVRSDIDIVPALIEASSTGSIKVFRYLFDKCPPRRSSYWKKFLGSAVDGGHENIIGHLYDQGLTLKDDKGHGAEFLNRACTKKIAIVQQLLRMGAEVSGEQLDSSPLPIHHAVDAGCVDIVELLLKENARIGTGHDAFSNPVVAAISKGFTDIVCLLLKNGGSDSKGNTYIGRTDAELETIAHYLIQERRKTNNLYGLMDKSGG